MENFTINQLKTIIEKTGIKHKIKKVYSMTKQQLLNEINKYVHFDGYRFHIKSTEEEKFLTADTIKKDVRHHAIKTNKKDINYEQMSSINESINKIKSLLEIPKKNKKVEEKLVKEEPKKIKIKIKKGESEELKKFKKNHFGMTPKEWKEYLEKEEEEEEEKYKLTKKDIMGDMTEDEFINFMEQLEYSYPDLYKKKIEQLKEIESNK